MIIDAFALARNGETRLGEVAIAQMSRLEVMSNQGFLSYSARGSIGERGRSFLALEVTGELTLRCERCLQPMQWPIHFTSKLWLAKSDEEADTLPIEQDAYDVIVGSDQLDLEHLVEDEVILALPVVAKHEHCPKSLKLSEVREMSPFEVLRQLKKSDDGSSGH